VLLLLLSTAVVNCWLAMLGMSLGVMQHWK
jgi:hypothetical protein